MPESDVARIRHQIEDNSLLSALPVSQGALSVLASVLYPYQKLVKSSTPPSARRAMLLATIEKLRTRITTLSSQGEEGTRLVLTDEEVSIIDQALTFFIQSIKSMVPASQQRDETLEACRHLQFLMKETFHLRQ